VLVHKGKILGEGYHQKFGGPHAEVHALQQVGDRHLLPECTLYVSLEPCSHYGKTPPCAESIVQAGIKKVVIAMIDPNPQVSGKGIQLLRSQGIEVTEHLMEAEARELNRRFICYHENKRPYIILKWARSADGCIAAAGGKTTQITGEQSRLLVHKWRAEEMAILVGSQTVIMDAPKLSVRHWKGPQPLRIVLDPEGKIPRDHIFFHQPQAPYLLVTRENKENHPPETVLCVSKGESLLPALMEELYRRQVVSVLVEGGAFTHRQFISEELWDEARIGINKSLFLKEGISAPEIHGELVGTLVCENDNWSILKRLRNEGLKFSESYREQAN
jgi:diaminohydroxyphosphoribosylaminopyrimidine deaminase/5-amino-6-(5-phosphoribosylamino)uracil reductase